MANFRCKGVGFCRLGSVRVWFSIHDCSRGFGVHIIELYGVAHWDLPFWYLI